MPLKEEYIRSNFSFIFSRNINIRRMANKFEDILSDYYRPPQINGVPDEYPSNVPRIIFISKNNYSKIIISQTTVVLEINYSKDYSIEKIRGYLIKRFDLVKKILDKISKNINFAGLTSVANIPMESKMKSIEVILNRYFNQKEKVEYADIHCKKTKVIDSKYYLNISVRNYKIWKNISISEEVLRLSDQDANEFGVEISIDYNDRLAFNEDKNYFSDLNNMVNIIDGNFKALEEEIDCIKKEG